MSNVPRDERGQAMLFTVILLSSALLGGTALVGFLMIHQLRQSADVTSSGQAVFAADAGLECALYYAPAIPGDQCPSLVIQQECGIDAPLLPCPNGGRCKLSNGAEYWVKWIDDGALPPDSPACLYAISNGRSRGAGRAFQLDLPQPTP